MEPSKENIIVDDDDVKEKNICSLFNNTNNENDNNSSNENNQTNV